MSTYTFTATATGTGYSGAWNDTWSTARGFADGLNTSSNTSPIVYAGKYASSPLYQIYRGFTNFDTSSIGDAETILSAQVRFGASVAFNVDTTSLHLVAGTQASLTTLANADYDQAGATSFGSINLSAIDGTDVITLNSSGLAHISKTGSTKFAFRIGTDLDNSTPTGKNELGFTSVTFYLDVVTPDQGGSPIFFGNTAIA